MGKIEITQKVTVYEVDGEEVSAGKSITVESHWRDKHLVVIRAGRNRYTVAGDDLATAIHNAMNTGS